jgi:hypothetical protein
MTVDAPTRYYAPQIRVMNTRGELVGATPVAGDAQDPPLVHFDVVSATVTLVANGVSEVSLVLNNQMFDADGKPTVPPWKYNGLDRVKFGERLRVDMSYGEQPWTKMILAQVNNLAFTFPASGYAQMTVTGQDLGCLLSRHPAADITHPAGSTEAQIVGRIVESARSPAFAGAGVVSGQPDDAGWVETAGSLVEWPAALEQGLDNAVVHGKAQTYAEFLGSVAERTDFEWFVDFRRNYLPFDETGLSRTASVPAGTEPPATPTLGAGETPNDVLLHFEPTRSLLRGGAPAVVFDLVWGQNLIDFAPTLKVWDLATSVELSGRSPGRLRRVRESIDDAGEIDAIVREDLGRSQRVVPPETPDGEATTTPGPELLPATLLRRRFLTGVEGVPEDAPIAVDFTNLDEDRAKLMARAALRRSARELCTVKAETIGFPSLRAGCHVDVYGVYAPFEGLYYVTKATHTIDSNGYRTGLELRRSGLQDPDRFPNSLAEAERQERITQLQSLAAAGDLTDEQREELRTLQEVDS